MNNQNVAAVTALLLFTLVSFSARAGELFVGASIGSASLDEDFDGLTVADNSTAFRISAGWRFNEYFAAEGGYHNFGDFEDVLDDVPGLSRVRLSADGFTLGLAGSVPVGERFALTGRAGAFFWNGSATVNNVSRATPEDSNLYFGAGLGYQASERLSVTADWTRYELDSAVSGVYSIGLQYRFR